MSTTSPPRCNRAATLSLFALNAVHTELDEQFLQHQELLLAGRLDDARSSLDTFAAGLALHVQQEDELLLPLFTARAAAQAPAQHRQATVLHHEHRKLLQLLDKLRAHIATLHRPAPRQLIALIEREAVFKHVLEHHGERENQFLFPELNRVTSDAERAHLMEQLLHGWMSAMQPQRWLDGVTACGRFVAEGAAARTAMRLA